MKKKEDPMNRTGILHQFRIFRSEMISFKSIAHMIRTLEQKGDDSGLKTTFDEMIKSIEEMKLEAWNTLKDIEKCQKYF